MSPEAKRLLLRALLISALALLAGYLLGPRLRAQGTEEDRLHLQVVLLRGQLAEALKAQAKCEAEGSQATQQLQAAQNEGQALLKALEARGLMVDEHNAIVAKPKTP